ncbi:MAG: ribokinase [Ilumatobacteraceae bacterium]
MPAAIDVTVVGSCNLDLVAGTAVLPRPGETVLAHRYDEFPGGKGLNQAVAAARSGARVAMVGAVGDDDAGIRLRQVAADEGIDTALLAAVDRPSGRALITVDDGAENSIVVVPGANATATATTIPDCSVVVAQLEVPIGTVIDAFAAARRAGARTVLNPAPAAPLPDDLVGLTDIIVPNEHEVDLLGGVEALVERGIHAVVVTRGAAGVSITEGTNTWTEPAVSVNPVDTTGAGDAFCGALVARLADGASLAEAVRWAAAAGALATTMQGAVPSLPSAAGIEALLADR